MIAFTARQPHATLIALGVQTVVATTCPVPDDLLGQRVAVHAPAERPPDIVATFGRIDIWPADPPGQIHPNHTTERPPRWYGNPGASWAPLAFDAIVGTVRVLACVPIYLQNSSREARQVDSAGRPGLIIDPRDDFAWYVLRAGHVGVDVSSQYGIADLRPGRYAVLLSDPRPHWRACPACGMPDQPHPDGPLPTFPQCPLCEDYGQVPVAPPAVAPDDDSWFWEWTP